MLGYTGTVTQEQLQAQEDSEDEVGRGSITYSSGDVVGQAGVEYQYESLLQGIKGEQTVTVDALGNVMGQAGAVPASAGSDIKLTLDLEIQKACESGLAHAIEVAKEAGYENAGAGACICLDCTNGEILGMASAPTFDPSVFIGGISSDDWDALTNDESGNPLLNRAIGGQYMSASTIKVLSSLAGLEYGIYSSSRTTTCTGVWTGNGEANAQKCWLETGHGTLNLQGGLANSCDPVFYDIGHDFYYSAEHPEGLQEMFRPLGSGLHHGGGPSQRGRRPRARPRMEGELLHRLVGRAALLEPRRHDQPRDRPGRHPGDAAPDGLRVRGHRDGRGGVHAAHLLLRRLPFR